MSLRFSFWSFLLFVVVGLLAWGAVFTVHQTRQAIVMQFGDPRRVVTQAGLAFKIPLIQNVLFYEKRVLNLDPPVENVVLSDQKRLLVDSFARYRITDPLLFFQSVRTERVVRQRLGSLINASLREVLGGSTLSALLSPERDKLLHANRERVNEQAAAFGVEIVDIRIRRADLPENASQAVYARMRTEREREAAEFRAQGYEQAQRITSSADRERTIIAAEAERDAQILRGQGDAEQTRILNRAYGQDPDFFAFYRSMEAYRESLANSETYMILRPDSVFFEFFKSYRPLSDPER